jgi:hypothetical protein
MTLLDGVSHVECRCPNGQFKLFCFGSSSESNGCCCGSSGSSGSCCCGGTDSAPSSKPKKQKSCCQSEVPSQVEESCPRPRECRNTTSSKLASGHAQVQGEGCQKKLVKAESVVVTPTEFASRNHLCAEMSLSTPQSFLDLCLPIQRFCQLSWQSHQIPPPTDLVIALQHFLI